MAYSSGETTANTLNSVFQEVYADGFPPFYPDATFLVKNVKYKEHSDQVGGKYIVPVRLSREHGWTYQRARGGMFTLNGVKSSTYTRAEVEASNIVGQAGIDYEAAARAMKGKKSFVTEVEDMLKNLMEDGAYRQELSFLYGQGGLGAVNAGVTGSGTLGTGTDATCVVSAATWNTGTWAGINGARVTIVSSNLATIRVSAEIKSVNIDEDDAAFRTITFNGALGTGNNLTAGDLIFWESAVTASSPYAEECLGLIPILDKQSGTLFGIDTSVSPLWRASRYNVGGNLTVTHILKAAARNFSKTGMKDKFTLMCSPAAFQTFINPLADPIASGNARKIDSSYKAKLEVGNDSVKIYAQNGVIEVVPHLLMRDADAVLGPMDKLRKVGARDLSFQTPGSSGEIFVHNPTKAGYEVRCYGNQAIMPDRPADWTRMYGITA